MYKFVKRFLDLLISFIILVIFLIPMIIIGIMIKIDSKGPVLFTQVRTGKGGKNIKIYKFRSMVADNDVHDFSKGDQHTKVGNFLRKTSLDEIPEFINILKGDMSFIGPRPLAVAYLPYYNENEKHRHDVLPGLTGLAQVNGRNGLQWEERFAYDIEYVNNVSFMNDLKIMFLTIKKVLCRSDIVVRGTGKVIDINEYRRLQNESNR